MSDKLAILCALTPTQLVIGRLNVRHTLKSDRCGDEAIDVELKQTSFTINTIRSPGSGVSTDLAESKVGPPSVRALRSSRVTAVYNIVYPKTEP